jgi:hypothetical protein
MEDEIDHILSRAESKFCSPNGSTCTSEAIGLLVRRPVLPLGLQPPFHLDGIGLSQTNLRYVQLPAGEQSDGTCYSIRSYRVTRDDPESDSTRLAGYSTCQPAARFQLKDAGDSLAR